MRRSSLVPVALVLAVGGAFAINTTPALAGNHAPVGFRVLCLNHPTECKGGGASAVPYSSAVMQAVIGINTDVNSRIRPKADSGPDVWSVNVTTGDCEDYVMTKRRALIGAGLPASSLRIAWVKTGNGEQHAVLVLKTTDRGDLVLDNLSGSIRPISRTGYRVLAISGPDPKVWE